MERTNPTQEQYILELFSSDAYLTINKRLLRYYGPEVAIFLSNLIDKYKYFLNQDILLEKHWFYLIHKTQMEETGLTLTSIRNCKAILKEDGVLETEMKGVPAMEYYKLNLPKLLVILPILVRRQDSGGLDVRIPEGSFKDNKNISPLIKKQKETAVERNIVYLPIARYLSNIILTKKNIKHSTIQIAKWTNDIRQLVETNQVSIERIKASLKFYKEHIGEQYCPVIESGKSLKEKFAKLEAAMERDKHPYISNKKPSIIKNGMKFTLKDDEYFAVNGDPMWMYE